MSFRYLTSLGITCVLLTGASSQDANALEEVRRSEFALYRQQTCPASGGCTVFFPQVPASRAWLIKYVSCYMSIENVNGKVLYWYLYASNAAGNRVGDIHLRPHLLGTSGGEVTYNANEQAYLRIPAGATVAVVVNRDGSTAGGIPFVNCTIGGDNIVLQ